MADGPMNVQEAAIQLVLLLHRIDAAGIEVATEDCEQIFLLRRKSSTGESAHLVEINGKWIIR